MKIHEVAQYVSLMNPYMPRALAFLVACVKVGSICGLNNVEVKSSMVGGDAGTTAANIYVLTFLNSAGGKDKSLRDIDRALCDFIDSDFQERARSARLERLKGLKEESIELFPDNETEQKKYQTANRPRALVRELSDATLEGFVAMRQAYYQAGWGGTFVKISEFGDYITSDNMARFEFLSMLTEVYDHGDNNAKITKGERENVPVYNVPSNAIMHTSPAGLLTGKNRERLMNFLNRGIARRALVCYPEREIVFETEDIMANIEIKKKKKAEAVALQPQLKSYFEAFYNNTKCDFDTTYNTNNTFVLTEAAEQILAQYEVANMIESSKISENDELSGVASELSGRHWKALKLSGIIAAFEHPDNKIVTDLDVEAAIAMCDEYGGHLKRFYKAEPTAGYEKLYDYFARENSVWKTLTDIRAERFVAKDQFTRWFNENIDTVAEMLDQAGYLFEDEKNGVRGRKYRASKITKEVPPSDITISIGATNTPTEVHFRPATLPFLDMARVTGSNKAWCATTFKDNYRKDDNATGTINIISLDIDSGMTYEDAQVLLKKRGVRALVYTTRNHRRVKDKKPACDRFRIVLPLVCEVTLTKEEHKEKIAAVAYAFGLPLDNAARNISRLWFGNPEQEYVYIEGGALDLSLFKKEEIEVAHFYKKVYTGSNEGTIKWYLDRRERWGGRNETLFNIMKFLHVDKQIDPELVKSEMIRINQRFSDPLDEKDLHDTIFKSLT